VQLTATAPPCGAGRARPPACRGRSRRDRLTSAGSGWDLRDRASAPAPVHSGVKGHRSASLRVQAGPHGSATSGGSYVLPRLAGAKHPAN